MTAHPERAPDYLRHILEAIERATTYARRVDGLQAFKQDAFTQDAVIRNIEVIGEAATKLAQVAPDLIAQHPRIPWNEMRTMRNKIIHEYFDVDLDIVWSTIQQDLPPLAVQVEAMIQSLAP